MIAAILCGGEGTRLRPLTYAVPKPLLPLGSKPILEVTISRLREQGFRKFYLMVNYKAEMISSYFGSGSNFDVEIEYVQEKTKRGTAGPLYDLKSIVDGSIMVMNADLLTQLNFKKLMEYHEKEKANLTVALKCFERKLAYGIVDMDESNNIMGIKEKPSVSYLVNSGIYVLDSDTLSIIPETGVYLMTDLILDALKANKKVVGYQFTESWRDIGRMDDYMKVISDIENGHESDTDGVFI
jgi:NDP-sugar pyrophosphorylase family protein